MNLPKVVVLRSNRHRGLCFQSRPHHNSFAASQAFSSLRHCQIFPLHVSPPISWLLTDQVRLERILILHIDCFYSVNISRHLRLVSTFSAFSAASTTSSILCSLDWRNSRLAWLIR
ncbi:hypothetical protein HZ326_0175 [Fusarium oxysporum f. sp. albedinis]|nr:hypothetical protein HZ326_0175 [Fusarium oxysporum f. sp. albedinis]